MLRLFLHYPANKIEHERGGNCMQKGNTGDKSVNGIVILLAGYFVEVVTIILIVILFTACISKEYLKLNSTTILGCIGHFATTLFGTIVIGKRAVHKSSLWIWVCSGGFVLVELCVAMLFFDVEARLYLLNTVCVVLGTLVGSYLTSRLPRQKRGGRHSSRRRLVQFLQRGK